MAVAPAWYPPASGLVYLGHLPDETSITETFQIDSSLLPANACEIQIYAYISVQGLDPGFKRGYYEVYTRSTDQKYEFKCFMNIANVNDTVLNSDNFWLPFGEGIDPAIYVRLVSSDGVKGMNPRKPKRKKARGDMKEHVNQRDNDDDQVFGEAFLTGYRVKS